jgi:hypothetical protein
MVVQLGVWSNEKPTEPGWYWFRESAEERVVKLSIMRAFGGRLCFSYHTGCRPVEEVNGQWAGPIQPPLNPDCDKCGKRKGAYSLDGQSVCQDCWEDFCAEKWHKMTFTARAYKRCHSCASWERRTPTVYLPDGYCPIFCKNTNAMHGDRCTAWTDKLERES